MTSDTLIAAVGGDTVKAISLFGGGAITVAPQANGAVSISAGTNTLSLSASSALNFEALKGANIDLSAVTNNAAYWDPGLALVPLDILVVTVPAAGGAITCYARIVESAQ